MSYKELFNKPLPRGGADTITGFKDPTKLLIMDKPIIGNQNNTIIVESENRGFVAFFRFVDRDTMKIAGYIDKESLNEQLKAKGFQIVDYNKPDNQNY